MKIVLPPTQTTALRYQEDCIVIEFNDMKRFNLAVMRDVKLELIPLFVYQYSKFILNFEGFDFMDSTGIGCLILLSKSATRHHSQMKICNLAPNVRKTLEMLSIPMIIEIEDTIEDCIKNFKD